MPAIDSFNDFMNATGPAYVTGPEVLINDAVQQNYLWAALIAGKNMDMVLQGGSKIRDVLMLGEGSTYSKTVPNQPFAVQLQERTKRIEMSWTFPQAYMAWTDEEIDLNEGPMEAVFKKVKRAKEIGYSADMLGGLDADLLKTPYGNYADMETTPVTPLSLHAFCTEHILSTPDGYMGGVPTGWTNIGGIPPATNLNWANQLVLYKRGSANWNAPAAPNVALTGHNAIAAALTSVFGLLTGMDELFAKCDFRAPLIEGNNFKASSIADQLILASRAGINEYRAALRASNDQLLGGASRSDAAYQRPEYSGVKFIEVNRWNSNTKGNVWPAAASAVTDSLAGRNGQTVTQGGGEYQDITVDKGSRFMMMHRDCFTPVIHSKHFMTKDKVVHVPMTHSYYQTGRTWTNNFPRSRKRVGILSPVAQS